MAAENRAAVGVMREKKQKLSLMEFEDGKRYVEIIDGDTSLFNGLS